VSNFNFQTFVVLETNSTIFNQNYLSFLQTISTNMGLTIYAITVLSISYGSVNVTLQVSTTANPGSSAAITQQNALITTLASNNTVANMRIASSTITTNGGSNDNSNSGLSQTTIIILATVIPIGTLCNYLSI
jgi:hypothetical protein